MSSQSPLSMTDWFFFVPNFISWNFSKILNSQRFIPAVKRGDIKIIEDILSNEKMRLYIIDRYGQKALAIACRSIDIDCARLLLENGANEYIDCAYLPEGTLLQSAVRSGRTNLVMLFLEYNANTEVIDWFGRTALFTAVVFGGHSFVRPLLENGANPDTKDSTDTPILMWSMTMLMIETVKILIEYGADLTATNNLGRSAIYLAELESWREPTDNNTGRIEAIKKLVLEAATKTYILK